jgi:hypothetical protein
MTAPNRVESTSRPLESSSHSRDAEWTMPLLGQRHEFVAKRIDQRRRADCYELKAAYPPDRDDGADSPESRAARRVRVRVMVAAHPSGRQDFSPIFRWYW